MGKNQCRNLRIFRKESKAFQLTFRGSNGHLKDITNWTVYFTAKEKMEDSDTQAKIKKDVTSHSDPTSGKTIVQLTADDTDYRGSLFYDIKFKDGDNNTGILFHGRLLIKEPVTQRG